MNFSTHLSHRYPVNWKQLTIIWCLFLVVGIAQAQTNLPLNTVWETSSLTSEDLIIPTNTTSLSIAIKGGDGGRVQFNGGICNNKKILGGEGATVSATFVVGNQSDMLKPGGRLRVFTGQAGGVDTHACIEGGNYSGGGGGSTAVLYLPPGSTPTSNPLWDLLAVAGGGGGANRPTAGTTYKGKGANAEDCGDDVLSGITKGGKNMNEGPDGRCASYLGGIETGYAGGGVTCDNDGDSRNGNTMSTGYAAEVDGGVLAIQVGLSDLSEASNTGGTGGKADGGDGYSGGAVGAGGGGGGAGSSGGAGAARTPGGGGGSWLTQAFQITESGKSSGSDGGGNGNNGHVKLTASFVPEAICKSEVTVTINDGGLGQLLVTDVDNGTFVPDGYQLQLVNTTNSNSFNYSMTFTCDDVGSDISFSLELLDGSNNLLDDCSSIVKIRDQSPPTAWCVNPTIQLDANGQAALNTSQVNSGSSDNCGGSHLTFELSKTNFSCIDAGHTQEVTLTARDRAGNSATCKSYVTVEDRIKPSVQCQNLSVQLDQNGQAAVNASAIIVHLSDNCGNIADTYVDATSAGTTDTKIYDCSNIGENSIRVYVKDNAGNEAFCNASITVEDNIAPAAICPGQTLDAQNVVHENTGAGITALHWQSFTAQATGLLSNIEIKLVAAISNLDISVPIEVKVFAGEGTGGTLLASTITNVEEITGVVSWKKILSDQSIPVERGEKYTVSVMATSPALVAWRTSTYDPYSGGTSDFSSTIDFAFRTFIASPIPVFLDADGKASISVDQIDNGSSDNCGIPSRTLSQSSFDCSEVGEQTVTLTVTDNNGNSSSCNTILNVQDKTAPVALCQGTSTLDAQNPSASNLSSLGSLRWQSFTAKKTSTLTQIEILGKANFTPMNTTLTIKVYPGEGTGGTPLFSTSKQMTISPTTSWIKLFSDADIPVQSGNRYTVSVQAAGGLIFWRASGFSNPYSAGRNNINSLSDFAFRTYTIEATPVQLDAAGDLNITLDQIDNGSTDACGIANRTLNQSSFDCSEVGEQTVTLTVTDNNGNSSSCNTLLNVQDKTAPVALCQGTSPFDAQNTSTSNSNSLGSLRWQSFTAQRTSTLTQIEILGRSNFTPMNTTLTIKVYPGEGTGGTPLFSTSKQMTISPTTSWIKLFSDADIPVQSGNRYTVSVQAAGGLIFWKASGFSNPYSAGRNNINSLSDFGFRTYTSLLPEVVLDDTGSGSIAIDQVDAGSNDACGIANRNLSQTSFDCTEVGEQTVTLTVTDHSGNASTCEMNIQIVDNTAPVAICQSPFIELDADGNASITPLDIDNGSSDACGITERSLDISDFNCQDLGENTVVLTVKDINGNQSQCTTTVEVLDVTAPDVLADLVFVSGDASSANFEVDVAIDDVCDIDPTLVSVMEIAEVHGLDISYKVKNKKKIKVSFEDNTVKVEAPDPVDFWEQIVEQGGIYVSDGQVIKLNREASQEYLYQFDGDDLSKIIGPSFSLLATGTDASGNTSTATAIPDFPGNSSQSALTQSANDNGAAASSLPLSQNSQVTQEQIGNLRSYPNPFSNFTNIEFSLGTSAKTSLQIFNLQGQRVFQWHFGRLEVGQYKEQWQGNSSSGDQLPAGLYLIQLQTGEDIIIEKVTLQR